MSARDPVIELLQEWRRHTLAETEAIRLRNWANVQACQDAKAELQELLSQNSNWPGGNPSAAAPGEPLRKFVEEIIALESRNRDLLASQKAVLEAQRTELHDRSRNLQRVRHSYAPAAGSRWQSYS